MSFIPSEFEKNVINKYYDTETSYFNHEINYVTLKDFEVLKQFIPTKKLCEFILCETYLYSNHEPELVINIYKTLLPLIGHFTSNHLLQLLATCRNYPYFYHQFFDLIFEHYDEHALFRFSDAIYSIFGELYENYYNSKILIRKKRNIHI